MSTNFGSKHFVVTFDRKTYDRRASVVSSLLNMFEGFGGFVCRVGGEAFEFGKWKERGEAPRMQALIYD